MAYLAYCHHLLFFMSLLYILINSNSITPSSNTVCPSFDCGNGIVIGYPFWRQSQEVEQQICGYPNFGLTCTDEHPILRLSDHLYRVKGFNLRENTITIAYTNLNNIICPVVPYGVTLKSSSILANGRENKMVRFFYNCSLYPPSLEDIKCLQHDSKRSFAFLANATPEFDWQRYCETTVAVPVIEDGGDGLDHHVANDFGKALENGFKLTWKPNSECRSCEADGGFCGFNCTNGMDHKFFCLHTDQRASLDALNKGATSINFKPDHLPIGALIFGGLILTFAAFYFFQRKRIGLQGKGFSQLSSSVK